jgi:purine-binding chemotaxis protein CheW
VIVKDPNANIQDYFDDLLASDECEQKEKLQKLLLGTSASVELALPVENSIAIVEPEVDSFDAGKNEIVQGETKAPELNSESALSDIHGLEWMPNGLPQWAQSRFDVLLFQVSGLTLAVPLAALGQILPITHEVTSLFGQADWFMGLQQTSAGNIRIVNTAKFVMPERYDDAFVKNAKYLVSINGVPWGLAVDSVNQPISLEPESVKWRTQRSQRPWLAGTVKQHMCALLDLPMFGKLLMNVDKSSTKNFP